MSCAKQEEFEALFCCHGSHAQFRYVAGFKRVFVLYLLESQCEAAEKELDGHEFEGTKLDVSRLVCQCLHYSTCISFVDLINLLHEQVSLCTCGYR